MYGILNILLYQSTVSDLLFYLMIYQSTSLLNRQRLINGNALKELIRGIAAHKLPAWNTGMVDLTSPLHNTLFPDMILFCFTVQQN